MSLDAPAISFVNDLITKAVSLRASDIHVEPSKDFGRIRFRIDGFLHEQNTISAQLFLQVISRIKVLSQMSFEQRRIPQDGKLTFAYADRTIDIRVATFPTIHGEKLVIRLLDRCQNAPIISSLGLEKSILSKISEISKLSTGFFLVTGPTGSGKTTTLHSMLCNISTGEKNIVTLEDPIEYQVCGITQTQMAPEIGFTFERGIRALLRQDPDVIMVGEIRDRETAQVAIQASLTGHLVLSTLHTADSCGALMRLIDMGIEPFLINATLTGILAQRLVRKLCNNCKFVYEPENQEKVLLKSLNLSSRQLHKSSGCIECNYIGYKGRTGIFELLMLTSSLRELISKSPSFDKIVEQAYADGMKNLLSDAELKLDTGVISLQELQRILI